MRMSDWSSEVCSSDLLGGVSELEQHTIDPVERFGHFLDHQHVIGEIGKPGRADHAGEDREVEGGGGAAAEAGLKPLAIVRGEPREAARSEEHTSVLPSSLGISYVVFFLKKHKNNSYN